jgi:hypothetical protein
MTARLCPFCGHTLNAASSRDTPRAPEENDLTVCIGCATPLAFNADLSLRLIDAAEMAGLAAEEQRGLRYLQKTVARAARMAKSSGPPGRETRH